MCKQLRVPDDAEASIKLFHGVIGRGHYQSPFLLVGGIFIAYPLKKVVPKINGNLALNRVDLHALQSSLLRRRFEVEKIHRELF
jgi:hypothetical protein